VSGSAYFVSLPFVEFWETWGNLQHRTGHESCVIVKRESTADLGLYGESTRPGQIYFTPTVSEFGLPCMKVRKENSRGLFTVISGEENGGTCCAAIIFTVQLMKHHSAFGRNGKHRSNL
jgi:hypothetical protein